jgi:hypothetical protein
MLILGSFLKATEVAQIFGLFFPTQNIMYILCNFDKQWFGLHVGRVFLTLIWSHWTRVMIRENETPGRSREINKIKKAKKVKKMQSSEINQGKEKLKSEEGELENDLSFLSHNLPVCLETPCSV